MRKLILLLPLAGCIPAPQQAATQQAFQTATIANGQLFCQMSTIAGPAVVAAATMAGAPIMATGAAQNTVNAVCAAINAIPIAPPAIPVPIVATPVVTLPGGAAPVATAAAPAANGSQSFTFTITPNR